jgi:regulatory protein
LAAATNRDSDSELDHAREVWKKKFGTPPVDAAEKAKQIRFMLSRGFAQEIIQKALRTTE